MSNVRRNIRSWFTMMQDTFQDFVDAAATQTRGEAVIQSVDRAIRVLVALQGGRRMSLGEIAQRLDLAPSTVHGIIRTLLAHGMVAQERDSRRYRLGPATLRLGNVYLDTLELRARAAGWAAELARRTGCAVRTGVLLLGDVVVVHHEPRPDGTRQMPEVGIVIPAHACALGKALLAFDRDDPDRLAPRSMTGETITSSAELKEQLADIATTGVAHEQDEAVLGECALAGPVFDSSGAPIGAIGLVVPSANWPTNPATRDAVRNAARAISRELGAMSWPPGRN